MYTGIIKGYGLVNYILMFFFSDVPSHIVKVHLALMEYVNDVSTHFIFIFGGFNSTNIIKEEDKINIMIAL